MDKNEQLRNIAQSLAAELSAADFPHFWQIVPRRWAGWTQTLKTNDAWIYLELSQGRLVVKADHPNAMKTSGQPERITIAADRDPEAIAQDIARRLLPSAREYFAQCREYTRKQKDARARHAETLARLSKFKRWSNTDSGGQHTEWRSNRTKLDMYDDHAYTMKIDNPTIEEIQKILEIVER